MFKNVLSNIKYYLKPQCIPRWKFTQELCLLMIFFSVFTIISASPLYIPLLCQCLKGIKNEVNSILRRCEVSKMYFSEGFISDKEKASLFIT